MYVCICNAVTDHQIRQAAADGAHSLACPQSDLGVATQCGRCADCASRVLSDARTTSGDHPQHVITINRGSRRRWLDGPTSGCRALPTICVRSTHSRARCAQRHA